MNFSEGPARALTHGSKLKVVQRKRLGMENSQVIDIRQSKQDANLSRCSLFDIEHAIWKRLVDILTFGQCLRMSP